MDFWDSGKSNRQSCAWLNGFRVVNLNTHFESAFFSYYMIPWVMFNVKCEKCVGKS